MLNNASFDAFVNLKPLGGSVVEINPSMEEFVEMIDERAEAVVDWLKAAVSPEVCLCVIEKRELDIEDGYEYRRSANSTMSTM